MIIVSRDLVKDEGLRIRDSAMLYTMNMIVLYFILWMLLGIPLVEVLGYWVHRLIFHHGALGAKLRRIHIHHHLVEYPPESLRPDKLKYANAQDPLWHVIGAIVMVILLILTGAGVLAWWQGLALVAGSIVYAKYVVSIMHQHFHLPHSSLGKYAHFRRLVVHHDAHHYVQANYGIVFIFMDKLFGTYQATVPTEAENIFPRYTEPRFKKMLEE